MKFCEITEKEYEKFWQKFEQRCFLSSPGIAYLNTKQIILYYGVKEGEKIVAAALIKGSRQKIAYDFYSPRGLLVDYNNKKLLKFFVENLKKVLHEKGGHVLRIDPNIEYYERDIDGEKVEGGYNNEKIVKNLIELGFKKKKYIENISQMTWQFVLPVAGKSEDELLSAMKSNARRRLQKAEDFGMEIKELKREEVGEFYKILQQTAERKNFKARDLEYYERIYDIFVTKGKAKFVSVILNPKKSLAKLEAEEKKIFADEPQTILAKKRREDALGSIRMRIDRLVEMFGKIDYPVTLSSGLFFMMQPEVLHLSGGNVTEYMKLDSQYVLQWEMIKEALKGGYERYNFYGIPENINLHPENYGVYEFKRGFNGKVIELIGEYELVLDPLKYKIITGLRKIKDIL